MADQLTITGDNLAVAANGQQIWPTTTTPPPNPEPAPTPGGTMKINNEADLRQAFAAAASGSRVVVDPSSPTVTVTSTIEVPVTNENFYFDGSGLQIATQIPNFGHLLEFTNGKPGFRLKNLYVIGSYPNRECGDALRFVNAHEGNENAFYNFSITGIRIEHVSGNGIYMEGGFEGSLDVIEVNDIAKSGVVIGCGPTGGSVVCQLTISNAQMSRCDGWGAEQIQGADQVTWISPKFVNNGMGGLHCTDGLHFVLNPQGENTGETLIVVDSQNWSGAEVVSLQVASNGSWVRNWVNPHTGPTRYGIKCPPGAVTHTGVFKGRGYGGPVELWAPGSAPSKTAYEAPDAQYAATKPGAEQPASPTEGG